MASSTNKQGGGAFERNSSIIMNPSSVGAQILPGGKYVYKNDTTTGTNKRKVRVDSQNGHFWMLRDLRETGDKPILSSTSLIPADRAQLLPPLQGFEDLTGVERSAPACFIRNTKRGSLATSFSGCTLVGIAFKDYGYQMLPGWLEPFKKTFMSNDERKSDGANNVDIVKLIITTRGYFLSLILKPILMRRFRRTTPENEKKTTLLYFGDPTDFRDALRMHNTLTCYLLLLDLHGRVRWIGSGNATEEEMSTLIKCARELVPSLEMSGKKMQSRNATR